MSKNELEVPKRTSFTILTDLKDDLMILSEMWINKNIIDLVNIRNEYRRNKEMFNLYPTDSCRMNKQYYHGDDIKMFRNIDYRAGHIFNHLRYAMTINVIISIYALCFDSRTKPGKIAIQQILNTPLQNFDLQQQEYLNKMRSAKDKIESYKTRVEVLRNEYFAHYILADDPNKKEIRKVKNFTIHEMIELFGYIEEMYSSFAKIQNNTNNIISGAFDEQEYVRNGLYHLLNYSSPPPGA